MVQKTTMSDVKVFEFARAVLANIPTRHLKPATERLYETTARLYYDNLEKALETTSKRTYYLRKAALTYCATRELARSIANGEAGAAATAMKVLARFMTDGTGDQSRNSECPLTDPIRRRSKRRSLRGLPNDWRQKLVTAAASHPLRLAILLMAATGVRPSEVENGVAVSAIDGGVRVMVRGTKIDREHGQPLRVFEIRSELAADLASQGVRLVKVAKANQLSVEVGRLGRRLFGSCRSETVSAYSLRHAFASDLKSTDLPGEELSAILGHSVADTKKQYGSSRQGRALVSAKLVHATRTVKSTAGLGRPNASRISATRQPHTTP